jgi:pyruvate formate lyase activating enzyme
VKLDTNGYRPDVLQSLVEAGLVDYVAMDVKNSPSQYAATTGLPGMDLQRIEESLRYLIRSGVGHEFRTTVVEEFHSEASVLEMGQWLSSLAAPHKPEKLFLQCFVDRESVLQNGLHAPQVKTLEKYVEILTPYVGQIALRGV